MATRKDFIRNVLMGIAVTMLPKTLLPTDGTIAEVDGAVRIETLYEDQVYTIFCGRDMYNKMNYLIDEEMKRLIRGDNGKKSRRYYNVRS